MARRKKPKRKAPRPGPTKVVAELEADPTDERWHAVVEQIERHRHARELDRALALARRVRPFATDPERKKRLALEGALAAFGAGRDEEVSTWVQDAPAVAAFIHPALDAVSAEPRVHTTPRARSAAARKAMIQVAGAVVATREGDVTTARRRLTSVRAPWGTTLDVEAHRAAVTIMAQTRLSGQVAASLAHRHDSRGVAICAIEELSAYSPKAAANLARSHGLACADLLQARSLSASDPRSAALHYAARASSLPDDPTWRLYRLFAAVGDGPRFDRLAKEAERAPGSKSEVARAQLLEAIAQAKLRPGRSRCQLVGTRALALAEIYAQEPGGTLPAGSVRLIAARAYDDADRAADARRALLLVRDGGHERMRALAAKRLIFLDLDAGNMKRAAVESEVQCELHPEDAELWNARMTALSALGRSEEIREVLRQAAKATGEETFVKRLRRLQLKDGVVEPFDGLVSSMTSPVVIVLEMASVLDSGHDDTRPGHVRVGELLDKSRPLWRRMAPDARAAVKLAALTLAEEIDETTEELLDRVIHSCDGVEELRHVIAVYSGLFGELPDFIIERRVERGDFDAIALLLATCREVGASRFARRWTNKLAPVLKGGHIAMLKAATEDLRLARRCKKRVDEHLAPEFDLRDLSGLAPYEIEDELMDDDDEWGGFSDARTELESYIEESGMSELFALCRDDEMAELERLFGSVPPDATPDSPGAVAFQLAFQRIASAAMMRLQQRGFKGPKQKKRASTPRTPAGKNKQKQKRRQRKKGKRR